MSVAVLAPTVGVEHPGASWRASPNFGERYSGKSINSIVLHYTGMEDGKGAEDWLCDRASGVSSHYLVHEDGHVVQMVLEKDRAWHAGIGCWRGERDMNSVSVGIEIVNAGHRGWSDQQTRGTLPHYPDPQIGSVIELCHGIVERWDLDPTRIVGHSDLAPHRKRDPGEAFPWQRLCDEGLGLCVEPTPLGEGTRLGVSTVQAMLGEIGFEVEPTGTYCPRTAMAVAAFQRHWRPTRVDGVADASTCETIRRLREECLNARR